MSSTPEWKPTHVKVSLVNSQRHFSDMRLTLNDEPVTKRISNMYLKLKADYSLDVFLVPDNCPHYIASGLERRKPQADVWTSNGWDTYNRIFVNYNQRSKCVEAFFYSARSAREFVQFMGEAPPHDYKFGPFKKKRAPMSFQGEAGQFEAELVIREESEPQGEAEVPAKRPVSQKEAKTTKKPRKASHSPAKAQKPQEDPNPPAKAQKPQEEPNPPVVLFTDLLKDQDFQTFVSALVEQATAKAVQARLEKMQVPLAAPAPEVAAAARVDSPPPQEEQEESQYDFVPSSSRKRRGNTKLLLDESQAEPKKVPVGKSGRIFQVQESQDSDDSPHSSPILGPQRDSQQLLADDALQANDGQGEDDGGTTDSVRSDQEEDDQGGCMVQGDDQEQEVQGNDQEQEVQDDDQEQEVQDDDQEHQDNNQKEKDQEAAQELAERKLKSRFLIRCRHFQRHEVAAMDMEELRKTYEDEGGQLGRARQGQRRQRDGRPIDDPDSQPLEAHVNACVNEQLISKLRFKSRQDDGVKTRRIRFQDEEEDQAQEEQEDKAQAEKDNEAQEEEEDQAQEEDHDSDCEIIAPPEAQAPSPTPLKKRSNAMVREPSPADSSSSDSSSDESSSSQSSCGYVPNQNQIDSQDSNKESLDEFVERELKEAQARARAAKQAARAQAAKRAANGQKKKK